MPTSRGIFFWPASSRRTSTPASSLSRAASTQPADPAPTTTTSTIRDRGYNVRRRPGDRGVAAMQRRGKSGHRRAGRSREGGGESRRKVAQKTDRLRRSSGGDAGKGETVGEEPTSGHGDVTGSPNPVRCKANGFRRVGPPRNRVAAADGWS